MVSTNGAAVMESIATFDSLFFATRPKGEYANVIDHKANVDLHLLLPQVSAVRFEIGESRREKEPIYTLRVLGTDRSTVVLSLFLQWDKTPMDVESFRIDNWKELRAKYVTDGSDTVSFTD